jgi:hypothetical protein
VWHASPHREQKIIFVVRGSPHTNNFAEHSLEKGPSKLAVPINQSPC